MNFNNHKNTGESWYKKLISAGDISPGDDIYTVIFAPDHRTLNLGDRVVMREDSNLSNMFVRINDLTIHDLMTSHGYVLVVKEWQLYSKTR